MAALFLVLAASCGTSVDREDGGSPGVEFGMPMDEICTLQTSKTADILVVSRDPLVDIQALEKVQIVVHDGKIVSSS